MQHQRIYLFTDLQSTLYRFEMNVLKEDPNDGD